VQAGVHGGNFSVVREKIRGGIARASDPLSGDIVICMSDGQTVPFARFMMRFELGLERPDPKRALVSATMIAGAYMAGGQVVAHALHF
jgi:hypothetical protein